MSKCPNCGGELTFNVEDEKVVCPFCRSEFNPKELQTKTKFSKESETFEGKSYNCRQCGATLLTFDETAITFCSYCGSQNVIESKMVKVNNPDFVIPFKITKEECIKLYKNYIKKSLFVPDYMKDELTIERFRGIFIPYCIYKTSFHGLSVNTGEKYSHRSGDYIYYDKYRITAHVDADYEGISYDLLSKFYDSYSMSIPFDYNGIIPFNKNYLIGYYADTKDVENNIYDIDAEYISSTDSSNYLNKRREFYIYGCKKPTVNMTVSDRKTGMFPVYFLAVRDKQDKLHYAIINGQTGKIAVDLPIDFKKFVLGTLIISLIIFGLLYFGSVYTPMTILIFSMIAALLSLVISMNQLSKIYDKNNHIDDKGYRSQNKKEEEITDPKKKNKKPKKYKFSDISKQLLCIIGGFLVILSGTIRDEVFYIASFVIFFIIIISFKDLIKEHNIISSNKPPQLEKRGGDENGK